MSSQIMLALKVEIAASIQAREREIISVDRHMRLELRPCGEWLGAGRARVRLDSAPGIVAFCCVIAVAAIVAVVVITRAGLIISAIATVVTGAVVVVVAVVRGRGGRGFGRGRVAVVPMRIVVTIGHRFVHTKTRQFRGCAAVRGCSGCASCVQRYCAQGSSRR